MGRHFGLRALSVVLAFALMCVTWPQFELHAHGSAEHPHVHADGHHAHDLQLSDDPDAPSLIHLHDASSAAWTLPSCLALLASAAVAGWIPALTFESAPLSARAPPHRPPIV